MRLCLFIKSLKDKILNSSTIFVFLTIITLFSTKSLYSSNFNTEMPVHSQIYTDAGELKKDFQQPAASPIDIEVASVKRDVQNFHEGVSDVVGLCLDTVGYIIEQKKAYPNQKIPPELINLSVVQYKNSVLLKILNRIKKSKQLPRPFDNYNDDINEVEETMNIIVSPLLRCLEKLATTDDLTDINKILYNMVQTVEANEEGFFNRNNHFTSQILDHFHRIQKAFIRYAKQTLVTKLSPHDRSPLPLSK